MSGFYDPDTLRLLSDAFTAACKSAGIDDKQCQAQEHRAILAQALLHYANLGLRDEHVLRGMALGALESAVRRATAANVDTGRN